MTAMSGELAEHVFPPMLECMPDNPEQLDEYQARVAQQIHFDDNGVTIQGYPAEIYMYLGLLEEIDETWQGDHLHPEYNRLRTLLGGSLLVQDELDKTIPSLVSDLALQLHRKELGDISWYLANLLNIYGISLCDAVVAGEAARIADRNSQPKCDEAFCLEVEQTFPFFYYAGYMSQLEHATEEVLKADEPENRENLRKVAGKFILSMAQVAKVLLDTTYEDILRGNIVKIDKRITDGTVFDKTGGDTR